MAIPDIQAEVDLRQLWCEKTGGHYQDKRIVRPMAAATTNFAVFTLRNAPLLPSVNNPWGISSITGWWCRCGA